MNRIISILLLLVLPIVFVKAQEKAPYIIYNSKGKKVKYKKMHKLAEQSDIILFGEYHNNPIVHWLQLELFKDLQQTNSLILGLEMLEADNQDMVDQYLSGAINYKGLDSLARLWPNYATDYKPIVDFANVNSIAVVASNIPRRYARRVYKEGGFEVLDSLTAKEKAWIAPLPISFDANLPQYKKMLDMMQGHGSIDMVKAQAVKDATMAHFILSNYESKHTFVHLNGAFHSDFYEGILWYLRQQNQDLNYMTISTVEQADIQRLDAENIGRADFIICVDDDMTKTY